jgi:hypothetical protein
MPSSHLQVYDIGAISKQRPFVARGRAFTPKRTVEFEDAVKAGWTGPLFEGPCYMIVNIQKDSFTVEVGPLAEPGEPPQTSRPRRGDIDNYVKSISDGLNGVAFRDDKQVWFVIGALDVAPEILRQASEGLRGK